MNTIIVINDEEKVGSYSSDSRFSFHTFYVDESGALMIIEEGKNARGEIQNNANHAVAAYAPGNWTHVYLDK